MIGLVVLHIAALSRLCAEISSEHLRELQRFAEVGRVSAGLIHDMSSPLTAAILHLEQEEQHSLTNVRHARRSIRVLERYIEAVRQQLCQQDRIISFCVKREISQAEHILQPLAQRQAIKLNVSVREAHQLTGDPVKFQRVVTNLVTNAIDAYQDSGCRRPSIRVVVTADQHWLIIRVLDQGKGIADEELPHLFEPFYTSKPAGGVGGMGIGLSTVRQYVEDDFRGTISVTSSACKGTEFQVKLPFDPGGVGQSVANCELKPGTA